jgi:protein-L-isoaspartate(D-aspartate) O-methyltransferase
MTSPTRVRAQIQSVIACPPLVWATILLLGACRPAYVDAQQDDRWQTMREAMVEDSLIRAGIRDPRVLQAMRITPRHQFVPRQLRPQAYLDMALPIGEGQTISSPFIVAYMTECLAPQPQDRVLEIGTGSGYQAAVLSPLVQHVYTIEIIESLGRQAARTLKQLRIQNVSVKIGDGYQGWPEHAPFDKIVVTCSPEDVPRPLIDQLRDGGRLVIPVGERYQQTMYLLRKENGQLQREALLPTLFVPMTGLAERNRDVQPDPARPRLLNGSFEEDPREGAFIPGWYYERQAELASGKDAPQGGRYVLFRNTTAGLDSHLMQGLAIDGRQISRIRISGWIKTTDLDRRLKAPEGPRVVVSFFDQDRRDLGLRWIGPWLGDTPWQEFTGNLNVPNAAREMILRIGLFGVTGTAAFDNLQLEFLR